LPYLYIDRVFHELRDELLSAMRLYRSFTRAAAKEMANPVQVSDKCVGESSSRARKGAKPREEE
jgi:hypothetical protein